MTTNKFEALKLKGFWTYITYEEAFNGAIGKLFYKYTENKKESFTFYGISVHKDMQGFHYYIGTRTHDDSDLIVPEGEYYVSENVLFAYETYEKISKMKLPLKMLFGANQNSDPIPVKIEEYISKEEEIVLKRIRIPLK